MTSIFIPLEKRKWRKVVEGIFLAVCKREDWRQSAVLVLLSSHSRHLLLSNRVKHLPIAFLRNRSDHLWLHLGKPLSMISKQKLREDDKLRALSFRFFSFLRLRHKAKKLGESILLMATCRHLLAEILSLAFICIWQARCNMFEAQFVFVFLAVFVYFFSFIFFYYFFCKSVLNSTHALYSLNLSTFQT